MKKILLFFCLGFFLGASFAQEAPQNHIYTYQTIFDLPNGLRQKASVLIDEINGKIKIRFLNSEGEIERRYDTRDHGVFGPKSSAVIDQQMEHAFVVRKQEGQWGVHVMSMTKNAEGKFQFTPFNQANLTEEKIIPLAKFIGKDHVGNPVEAYFNPCENQISILKNGASVLTEDLFLQGNEFTGIRTTTPSVRTVFNYDLSYRKVTDEEEDVNGMYRAGMAWDSDHANELRLNLPKQEGTAMSPFDKKFENTDKIVLRSQTPVDFNDCLQEKLRGAENIVSVRSEEVRVQMSCPAGQEDLFLDMEESAE